MTDEILEVKGLLGTAEMKNSGVKDDGTAWTQWKYQIDGKWYSGFIAPTEMLNKHVIGTYTTKENPGHAHPYKNIKTLELATEDSKIAEPQVPENQETLVGNTPKENPAFFGMVFNRAAEASLKNNTELKVEFERLWKLAKEIKKEYNVM